MSTKALTILVVHDSYYTDDLLRGIRAIVPDFRIVRGSELKKDPSLAKDVEVVLGWPGVDFFANAPALRWVQSTSAGVDGVTRPQVMNHPAVVTNARIHAHPISEQMFGMLLMLTRCLHVCYRHQIEKVWKSPPAEQVDLLAGKTLCVVGLGVIGRRCAELGKVFGMRTIGVRNTARPVEGVDRVYGVADLNEALSAADVVIVMLPNAAGTRKLIGPSQFAAMRDGAYILNGGRGQTVDTDALVAALKSGKLRGAGLDVVDPEPLPADHPLWEMPNVILTPHCSGVHEDYEKNATAIFLDNLARFVAGQPLTSVVDKERGY